MTSIRQWFTKTKREPQNSPQESKSTDRITETLSDVQEPTLEELYEVYSGSYGYVIFRQHLNFFRQRLGLPLWPKGSRPNQELVSSWYYDQVKQYYPIKLKEKQNES